MKLKLRIAIPVACFVPVLLLSIACSRRTNSDAQTDPAVAHATDIKNQVVNTLRAVKKGTRDSKDAIDELVIFLDENKDRSVPDEHKATVAKLEEGIKKLKVLLAGGSGANSTRIDELIALANTLPGEIQLDDSSGGERPDGEIDK